CATVKWMNLGTLFVYYSNMKHTYQVTGMTCSGCEASVKSKLLLLPEVTDAEVSKENQTAVITMDKHVSVETLQNALGGPESRYQIAPEGHHHKKDATTHHNHPQDQSPGTYYCPM